MKIATWNVERLKHYSELHIIEKICNDLDADILVLTETDNRIDVENHEVCETCELPDNCEIESGIIVKYKSTERRVSIYTRFPIVRYFDTYDNKTSVAVEVETSIGNVVIYGTIIGILGNRDVNFERELNCTCADVIKISENAPMIICGDFNCSFSDNYYFTKHGRDTMLEVFDKCNMTITTAQCNECIDHIVVSNSIIKDKNIVINEWNEDKSLSDHKGVAISIEG